MNIPTIAGALIGFITGKASFPEDGYRNASIGAVMGASAGAVLSAMSDGDELTGIYPGRCPRGMVEARGAHGTFCIDRYEAPNKAGALPLVMHSKDSATAWCEARGKRLCYDDEWTSACEGEKMFKYPYGNTKRPGVCNDDRPSRFRAMSPDAKKQHGWPIGVASAPTVMSYEDQLALAKAHSEKGATAAEYVHWLSEATPSGSKKGCISPYGTYDMMGNVEEWTQRRKSSRSNFSGNLKGRFWAEGRTCRQGVTNHADGFKMYETGFRCCK